MCYCLQYVCCHMCKIFRYFFSLWHSPDQSGSLSSSQSVIRPMLSQLLQPVTVSSWRQLKTVQARQSLHDCTLLTCCCLDVSHDLHSHSHMNFFFSPSSSLFRKPLRWSHISRESPPVSPCPCSVQVLNDLLQQRVQKHVHLPLLQQLDGVDVVGDDLAQVGHFLEQLRKQLQGLWVADLQLQLQRVKHRLLETLDGLHVQQAGTVWVRQGAHLLRTGQRVRKISLRAAENYKFAGILYMRFMKALLSPLGAAVAVISVNYWPELYSHQVKA